MPVWRIAKRTIGGFIAHRALRLAAAIAFFAFFSLAPLLLLILTFSGYLLDDRSVERDVTAIVTTLFGDDIGAAIGDLSNVRTSRSADLATAAGLLLVALAASGLFAEVQAAFNIVWDVHPKKTAGVKNFIASRLLAIALAFLLSIFLAASIVLTISVATLRRRFAGIEIPGATWFWSGVQIAAFFALVAVVFCLLYKLLPAATVPWYAARAGAFWSALLLSSVQLLATIYVGEHLLPFVYGAGGALALILLWAWFAALVLLFGAELTRAIAEGGRSRRTKRA